MLGLNKSPQALAPFLSVCAAVQFMLGACSEPIDTHADSALPTLVEAVEGTIIVRSTQRDDLGSVETEILDTADDRALAVAWHYPSDNRYDYATPLDDSGRAHIRSIPLSERRSLADYNQMLVARYTARAGLPVEPYEQPAEYRRGCVLPFAHEHVACDDHCGNECCTSLQQCLWEVEHTGDIGGIRAVNCMHAAAMCHGTCGLCVDLIDGGGCNAPVIPGSKGEGLTCDLGDTVIAKSCFVAWDTATNLSWLHRRINGGVESLSGMLATGNLGRNVWDIFDNVKGIYDFAGDVGTAAELVDPFNFPGSKCGCDMHPCFDSHCADRLLGDLPTGLTGSQVRDRATAVLDDTYYCARDCQLDGPDGFHACKCPSGQEWCTEGTRKCKDGLPAWDEYGDVARCQVSCDDPSNDNAPNPEDRDDPRDSACWCRDRDAVLCLASVNCPTMGDACVHDQNGDGLHDHKDCEIWRDSNCRECGNTGDECCANNYCWHGGSECRNGICEPEDCGTSNNPCCSGGQCDDTTAAGELACISGVCRLCGGYAEPCCSGSTCCPDGSCWGMPLECEVDSGSMYGSLCEPEDCGDMGEACCLSGTKFVCGGDQRRTDGPKNQQLGYMTCSYYQDGGDLPDCIGCGLEGEACCRNNVNSGWGTCNSGLGCVLNTSEAVVSRGNSRGTIRPYTICRQDAPPTPTGAPNLIVQRVDGDPDWHYASRVIKNIGDGPSDPTVVWALHWDGCMGIPAGLSDRKMVAVPSLSAGGSTSVRAYYTYPECGVCVAVDAYIEPVPNESDTDNRYKADCSGGAARKCSSLPPEAYSCY
jgi:hypothetical protein